MSAGGSDSSQDFELNLAPIIDCFTVLITYLLVSASFISLNVLDVGVAASGSAESAADTTPPLSLIIVLKAGSISELELSGGTLSGPVKVETALSSVANKVSAMKKKWPELKDATLRGENGVSYKEVIRVVETLKNVIPKVYLAN